MPNPGAKPSKAVTAKAAGLRRSARQYGVKKTPQAMEAAIRALAMGGSYTKAGEAAGVTRDTIFNWKREDPAFKALCEEAVEMGTDSLEDEAVRRARDGVDKPVFYQGEEVAVVKEYSDPLMQIMLKARRPDRFKDRVATEMTGAGGGPIETKDVSARDLIASRLAGIANNSK